MMKKLIALLLAMIMVLSLVACSGQTAKTCKHQPTCSRHWDRRYGCIAATLTCSTTAVASWSAPAARA